MDRDVFDFNHRAGLPEDKNWKDFLGHAAFGLGTVFGGAPGLLNAGISFARGNNYGLLDNILDYTGVLKGGIGGLLGWNGPPTQIGLGVNPTALTPDQLMMGLQSGMPSSGGGLLDIIGGWGGGYSGGFGGGGGSFGDYARGAGG